MVNCLDSIKDCTLCDLHKYMPEGCKPVKGDGPLTADLMIVGEALGKTEALMELPFQGMAGKMLDKMLEAAGSTREEVYITNVVKCRPYRKTIVSTTNRPPTDKEIDTCKEWLYDEIFIIQPKVILTLGKIPTSTLLYKSQHMQKKTFTLKDMVGKQYPMTHHDRTQNIMTDSIILPVFHPSYLLQHGRKQVDKSIEVFKLAKELV